MKQQSRETSINIHGKGAFLFGWKLTMKEPWDDQMFSSGVVGGHWKCNTTVVHCLNKMTIQM